jgi:hypothetical protein
MQQDYETVQIAEVSVGTAPISMAVICFAGLARNVFQAEAFQFLLPKLTHLSRRRRGFRRLATLDHWGEISS